MGEEIAIRFHHRLVQIHPFVIGETWTNYIQALKAADNHDLTALLRFARS